MIQQTRAFLLTALSLLLGCGAGERTAREEGQSGSEPSAAIGTPVELWDVSGRILTLPRPPTRIISLVPSASETLLAIGAGDLLVGRTDFDTEPLLANLPSVGGGLHPNIEAILALSPELVIRFAGETDTRTPDRLDQMGIPHFAIDPRGIAEIRLIIQDFGVITGRKTEAGRVLAEMDAALEGIRDRVRGRPRPRVAYLLGGSPPWVAGPDSFIDDLLAVAGAENAFADLVKVYGPVNTELFLAREIDLLLAAEGAEIALPDTNIPLRRVSAALEIPGPLLAQAALEMARAIHPEVFR